MSSKIAELKDSQIAPYDDTVVKPEFEFNLVSQIKSRRARMMPKLKKES